MYPAQTSLIPIHVALARYLEQEGIAALFSNYPYWYLGTTPYNYLTGPVLPTILALAHRLLPGISLFDLLWFIIAFALFAGSIGFYLLIRCLGGHRLTSILTSVFFLFGPIAPILFKYSDGLSIISFSFLPFVLLAFRLFLTKKGIQYFIYLYIAIAIIILLDANLLPTLLIGLFAVLVATSGWEGVEEKLVTSFKAVFLSLLTATLWYSPGYWLTLLGSPSFGGQSLLAVGLMLGKIVPIVISFVLAVVTGRVLKLASTLRVFTFYWLCIFLLLTGIRFLNDPDFWLDWSAYGLHLQLGLAIVLAMWVNRAVSQKRDKKAWMRFVIVPTSVYLLLFTHLFSQNILGTLQKDIQNSPQYRIGKYMQSTAINGKPVLFSGTTVFWLNSFFDVPQVRGGVDQVSLDPVWRKAVWEIREGEKASLTEEWLKELKIGFLVIHTEESAEYWHDFKNVEKFESIESLRKVYDEEGDIIYQVTD